MDTGDEDVGAELQDIELPHKPHHNRRKKTVTDWILMAGSLAGACVAVAVVVGWLLHFLPFAMADDVIHLKDRVTQVEDGLKSVKKNQLETLELQLMDREGKLDDRLSKIDPHNIQDVIDTRRDKNEIHQRLENIRKEING